VRYLVIGNPEHRRVGEFADALAAQGQPAPVVVAWRAIVEDARVLEGIDDQPMMVRIDSFGQNFDVEKALLARGFADARASGAHTIPPSAIGALREDRGRILAPRQHHFGVERVLADVARVLARKKHWVLLQAPTSIRDLFDKRVTSRRYAELGIPVPRALPETRTREELDVAMREAGVREAYVKLSCGSSASCLAIYDGASLTTTIERAPLQRLYNSRRLRTYTRSEDIDGLLSFLLREGSHVEARVPKATLDGAFFDCRVLVVAGEPAFVVVRTSPNEITNLHLGGKRGDPAALTRAAPRGVYEAALESARRVFAAHECLHIGVDVMFERGFTGHRVLEANAFGDLFPGLSREGLSVYEWEIRAASSWASGRRRLSQIGAAGIRSSTPAPKTS
jgi:hypothetical protein